MLRLQIYDHVEVIIKDIVSTGNRMNTSTTSDDNLGESINRGDVIMPTTSNTIQSNN